jgi:putative glutamine amidotransferase
MAQRPIIGITCMDLRLQDAPPRFAQNQSYVAAVERAGGAPLLIAPTGQVDCLSALYARCDGLLLPGGGDMDPGLYHQETRASLRSVSRIRDDTELVLARWALDPASPKPVLAICRGIQVLNVALGGTLYQDLSLRRRQTGEHDWQAHRRTHLAHAVHIVQPSRLHTISGAETLLVNSLHHQAIRRLAAGLTPTGRAPDGVVEAVEAASHPFALGVQWHPEELAPSAAPAHRLFDAFVEACSTHRIGCA